MHRRRRSTPDGEHIPVLLSEVLTALSPRPSSIVVDCTLGFAGHSVELLRRITPGGRLISLDLDPDNLPRARPRLESVPDGNFSLHHSNFAGLAGILGELGIDAVDCLLADLGMSSMQVDDPDRGFSYSRDGPLDMRMDRSRGRPASQVLATISAEDLAHALRELGDEPEPERVAALLVAARQQQPLERTSDVAKVLVEAAGGWKLHPAPGKWNLHPAARTFQALRILVNRELANLEQLLRILPTLLRPGGRAAIISFHSGEDRLVKTAFRNGLKLGQYEEISPEPVRASYGERGNNPRSRSAKLRWARRAEK
jgi:16S rRNA (cytosine1402-N4)-methyltransferase